MTNESPQRSSVKLRVLFGESLSPRRRSWNVSQRRSGLKITNDVAFGHVADGLPDAVGGSASTRIGEVGEGIPRGRIAAVDVVADETY